MCPQRADTEARDASNVTSALSRGAAWLAAHIAASGRIGDADLASLYFKVPAALALNGELGLALRSLDWVTKHYLGVRGELAVPADQPAARSYDRGWLMWGASMCGRYDIAFRLADDLRACQAPSTGGFWDVPGALEGTHHAMTAGMAGLGLLSVGDVAGARRAADFLIGLLRLQPNPDKEFFLVVEVTAAGEQRVAIDRTPSNHVNRMATRQRPARLGPVQILLSRLHQLVGEARYLEAALAYSDLFLDGAPGIVDCVEAHKFLWGLEELYLITPDPRLRATADRIVAYLLSKQKVDGQWWGDAIGGDSEGQSLDLRLNTTCNVLVGLGYHRHLRLANHAHAVGAA